MNLVLDSSIALSWCFEDERTPATTALLDQVTEHGAVAPLSWPLEVLNGLIMAERCGRLDAENCQHLSGFLHQLPVVIDHETGSQAWTETAALAVRFRLTIYNAVYLELAQRLRLPLASLDPELRIAGSALGITVLGS